MSKFLHSPEICIQSKAYYAWPMLMYVMLVSYTKFELDQIYKVTEKVQLDVLHLDAPVTFKLGVKKKRSCKTWKIFLTVT